MKERVVFKRGRDVNELICKMSVAPAPAGEDELLERTDRFVFQFYATANTRNWFANISGMFAEATRSMPGRSLRVLSATPTSDRVKMKITCEG